MKSKRLAICVAGGANKDGTLPLQTQKRADKAIELFNKKKIDIILFSTGQTHRFSFKVIESEAMRAYAIKQGLPPQAIFCETMSRDTFGNAVFCRTLYVEPKRIKEFSVITSAFHMPKTKLLFSYVFPKKQGFKIKYIEVDDIGLDKRALKIRLAHEKYSYDFYKKEILPETPAGEIDKLIIWHLENNPSHTNIKNEKFKKFEKYVKKHFSGDPLY